MRAVLIHVHKCTARRLCASRRALKCRVGLLSPVNLTNYGQIATAEYAPPPAHCFAGAQAVLDVFTRVGMYDRRRGRFGSEEA